MASASGSTSSRRVAANAVTGAASMLIATLADLLPLYLHTGYIYKPHVFSDICFSLAKGIDHAVANNEVPIRARELPPLLKQVLSCRHEFLLQVALMMLTMSVKSACKVGWFPDQDTDDLLMLAKEVEKSFSGAGDICIEPSYALSFVSEIMSRFYPQMKMDRILVSFKVKPGFETFVVDFHIARGMVAPRQENIWLFVAQMDNMETSSCVITPPEAEFLLNGKGVVGRISVAMDNAPQLPTNVTQMLKYGVNLLQAVGRFNGHYIVVLAVMSTIPPSDVSKLQDYVLPVASTDSELEIIKSPSRSSLNCPISQRRMRIPVKGALCKHPQCFDYGSYLEINFKRPSWRCPYCKQSVCYTDIRIDRNVLEVLRWTGDKVVDVLISANGTWKAVTEGKDQFTQRYQKSQMNQLGWHENDEKSSSSLNKGRNTSFAEHDQNVLTARSLPTITNNNNQNISLSLQGSKTYVSGLNAHRISNAHSPIGTSVQSPVLTEAVLLTHPQGTTEGGLRPQEIVSSLKNQSSTCSNILSENSAKRASVCTAGSGSSSSNDIHDSSFASERTGAYSGPTRSPSMEQNQQFPNPSNLNTGKAQNDPWVAVHASVVVPPVQSSTKGKAFGAPSQTSGRTQLTTSQILLPGQNSKLSTAMDTERLRNASTERKDFNEARQPIPTGDGLGPLPSENWRPSGRMRGALTGEAYSAALHQFMFQPGQRAQACQPSSSVKPSHASSTHALETNVVTATSVPQIPTHPDSGDSTNT